MVPFSSGAMTLSFPEMCGIAALFVIGIALLMWSQV
jgi:hypothetical protein